MQDNSSSANSAWGGRFASSPAQSAAEYTDSQHYDRKLYKEDILGSIAHSAMLARQGIITGDDALKIKTGLLQIKEEIEAGKFEWKSSLEDVHMNIESRLTEIIGDAAKKLHTGRSRNDQVGFTFRLYTANSAQKWHNAALRLCRVLVGIARQNQSVIMPGFTHLQPAQPVSLAQHMLAYASMFRRDCQRIDDALKRVRVSPLGAAALAGSTYPLDPKSAAREAGFSEIYSNSMDAVSDRDFVLELLFIASLIMMHLSRLCEEIILWANPAFGYIALPDKFATGSSIMPQKKNPDIAELMRGKTGRVYGSLMAMLTIMKGLPLTYNRDLQEDKEVFFDAEETVHASLMIMADMAECLEFKPEQMRNACRLGFLNATELADYLAAKGVPFRDAHHITGQLVALAEKQGKGLEDMPLSELQKVCPLILEDVYEVLAYEACIKRRETPGATGPESVKKQLDDFKAWLDASGN